VNDSERRRYEMFVRVRDFGAAHTDEFAANGRGQELFDSIRNVVSELNSHASAKTSGLGTARRGTATRASARSAVREGIEAISRTSRAMSDETDGIEGKFRISHTNNDQELLTIARSFATEAVPFSARFIAHELPASFIVDLENDIAAMEAAISSQSSGFGDQVAARAGIDDAVDRGVGIVRKLGAIIKNKYGDNPAVLAEWTSLSHTERSPKRHSDPIPPPPPPPATPAGATP
jgi:hypothetical protein